jgi:ABC-type glycerol-3-phosphate transport system permease component
VTTLGHVTGQNFQLGERGRKRLRRTGISIVLGALALLSFAPMYFMVVTSFKTNQEYANSLFAPPGAVHLANFRTAWHAASIGVYMRNSSIVSVASVALCIAVSVALAFAIVFLQWPGRNLVYTLCLVLLAVPPLLLLIPVFKEIADLNLVNSLFGVILLYAAFTIPFSVYLLVAYMRSLPTSVIEAAVLDGASVPGLLARVVVPLSVPAIGTACVFAFIFCWNEFIYAFILLQDNSVRTLPAGLAGLQGRFFTDFPVLLAATTLSVLPVIGVYVFFQRFLVRGIAVGVS